MKKILLSIFVFAVAFTLGWTGTVLANGSYFSTPVATSTATSTPSYYQVAATATTTLYIDSYKLAGTQSDSRKIDSATVGVQFIASSSVLSVLGWRYEYAIDQDGVDCTTSPLACDWYSDSMFDRSNVSTSTPNFSLAAPVTFSWAFSSSTDACSTSVVFATNNRGCKLITVPTPTRYTRVLFYRQPGSTTNGAVYARLVPVKEVKE